jgi:hypothetical protein
MDLTDQKELFNLTDQLSENLETKQNNEISNLNKQLNGLKKLLINRTNE